MIMVFCSVVFSAKTVIFSIGEYPPYTSESDEKGKLTEKIVREAFALEDYNVQYEYYPWKRAFAMVKEGQANGSFPWYKTEERVKEFLFPEEPVVDVSSYFFHLKNVEFDWSNIEDLKQNKIGATIGYSHIALFDKHGIQYDIASSDEVNLKKLLAGRIEAFPLDFYTGHYMIKELFAPEIAMLFTYDTTPLEEGGYYIMFSKQLEALKNWQKHLIRA